MIPTLLVFLGAGLGGALRHGVNLACARACGTAFPWGTLTVNILGSLVMGLIVAWLAFKVEVPWSQHARLFLTTGIGNGSTFRMIPVIFLTSRLREVDPANREAVQRATREGNTEAAATLGFSAAMAAYGGFFIPKSYGSAIALTGGPQAALYVFIAFYLVCIAVTWWHYARRNAPMPC